MIPMMMKFHEIPINYLDDFHIPGCFFDSQLKDLIFFIPVSLMMFDDLSSLSIQSSSSHPQFYTWTRDFHFGLRILARCPLNG